MDRILAAFMFFTRLPFGRIKSVAPECFRDVVHYWPLVGLLTGGTMAAVLWYGAQVLPYEVAVICAVTVRVLLTGALHEDGLADFLDGFGGGTSRQRILEIMKDSHIGSYGVIGLILYYLLLGTILTSFSPGLAAALVLSGDIMAKFIASQLVNCLPYARKEEESKAKVIYTKIPAGVFLANLLVVAVVFYCCLPVWMIGAGLVSLLLFLGLVLGMPRNNPRYNLLFSGASLKPALKRGNTMVEIYLIRHTSVDVSKDVFCGQTDVPLKETFEQEAEAVKERLAEIKAGFLPGTDFDYVFTSPLSRCAKLAGYCGYGEVAVRDDRLKEINFGAWELQRFDEIEDPVLQQWYADYLHVRATGGESFQDQYARVAEFLRELEQRCGEKPLKENPRIAIFTHGGVILCARIFSGEITPEQAFSSLTPYGGIHPLAHPGDFTAQNKF